MQDVSPSEREYSFKEDMIKGRIAETLIEELFLSLGFNVYRYGMENTVPAIMNLIRGDHSPAARNIKRMPDFVIQDKNGKIYFVEVKFRKGERFNKLDGCFNRFGETFEEYPYKDCYFIIVSKKHIKCITYKELSEDKEITPESHNYLGEKKEFELNKEVIIKFCEFAVKFFENV